MATCLEDAVRAMVRRIRLGLLGVVCLTLASAACDGDGNGQAGADSTLDGPSEDTAIDGTGDLEPDEAVDMAPVVLETACDICHEIPTLSERRDPDDLAPGDWIGAHGEGLVRYAPSLPVDAALHFEIRWPRRGSHLTAEDGCFDCHPVYADGRGHSVHQYPTDGLELAHQPGGTDCAEECHLWLGESHHASGFPDASGATVVTDVSGRPADLLEGADNGHARIWRDGYQGEESGASQFVKLLPSGCGGCHNLGSERHGGIATCSDCHKFESLDAELHINHVAAVSAGQASNDPSNPTRSPCLYCHNFNEIDASEPDTVYRGACYNCHLSGHQPVNADGEAHFWPSGGE